MFRGREITHQGIAKGIMERIANDVKEFGTVESFPRLDGRNMIMVVAPVAKEQRKTPPPAAKEDARE